MPAKEIAIKYLEYLEQGEVDKVIGLFRPDGIVESPLYGVKKAAEFYRELSKDTTTSKLELKGIFEQSGSRDLVLYFTYIWTLKSGQVTTFDVVDIITLDVDHRIERLKIIYDTVITRKLIEATESP